MKKRSGLIVSSFLIMIIVLSLSIFAFTACESKGPAEKVGEKIDQVVDKTSDKAEEIGKAIKK